MSASATPAICNRIDDVFARCREQRRAALILYLTSGFPTEDATRRILPVLAEAGCDLIELGVPFSDPIADGPVIQKASTIALNAGITLPTTLKLAKEFRTSHDTPLILFGALNPFLHRGLKEAAAMARDAGADGILAADLPLDEAEEFRADLYAEGLHLITLVAPTTPDSRLEQFAAQCTGFLYCISYKGTTGTKSISSATMREYLDRLRRRIDIPLAVGFGIKTPADVQAAVQAGADGVVVGTSLITLIEEAFAANKDVENTVREYVKSLAAALKKQ
ncbi:tryptophan synthase subunit alpha [soil metagenome]